MVNNERKYFVLKKISDEHHKIGTGKDYLYSRKGAVFTLDEDLPRSNEYTFIAKYLDNEPFFSLLQVNGMAAKAVAGFTACNTGRERTAAFTIKTPKEGFSYPLTAKLFSMPSVISLMVTTGIDEEMISLAKAQRALPKEIKPLVEIKEPFQLIASMGADSPKASFLPDALETMRDQCPYFRVLGFNGFESYVKWNFIEYEQGKFDWSYYDAVISLAWEYGLKWFPLIIGGSAYALPQWYREKEGFTGFKCLEHKEENNVPTIFNEHQTPYVKNYLFEFGRHYEGDKRVFGIRLGPSGNYGESQYPATGNWGYMGQLEHMHIGFWAGDKDASISFAQNIKNKYGDIERLNEAWGGNYKAFSEIKAFLPSTTNSLRKRKDFMDWYFDEMTLWCNRWGEWVRKELKSHDIYQSAGGWGFSELGSDFTDQTKGMIPIKGGIRATNEDESYELNFAITRMLSSAARFYNIPFGSEPAGYGTARSIVNRLYNIIVNNGMHLFYYNGNFMNCDESQKQWLKNAPLLEKREKPLTEVAVLYPDTLLRLKDCTLRYLDSSSFFSQVFPLRRGLDFDYCSEKMVLDNALEINNYKALVFLSRGHEGDYVEAAVLEKIDEYVKAGGTVIYPLLHSNAKQGIRTVEEDFSVFSRWQKGEWGKGKVVFIHTLREPLENYIDEVLETLKNMTCLNPITLKMLNVKKQRGIYVSALKSGKLAFYNDKEAQEEIILPDGTKEILEPLSIKII